MLTLIGTEFKKAVELLNKGELVGIPTETVYGLAANGTNELAIQKIFEAKGRPKTNPLILHFSNSEAILQYVQDFPTELKKLPKVYERVQKVREIRLESSRPFLAETPTLFAQITQPKNKPVLAIPRHSSENRKIIPFGK